jgi:hypothetical protein
MKTSDKLLLISFLSVLGLFGSVHLALYARYSHGDIITEKELRAERFIRYTVPAPLALSLEGGLNVRIIPSDTFSVEMEKAAVGGNGLEKGTVTVKGMNEESLPELSYRLKGDTLIITGNSTRKVTMHDPWQIYYNNFPRVNVYTGNLKSIRLSGGMAVLKGETRPGLFNTSLSVENALLWIGESYDDNDKALPADALDSVSIWAVNSMLVPHRNAVLRKLNVKLDDRSEIDDQQAVIGRSAISYSAGARINMTGANLKNLQPAGP